MEKKSQIKSIRAREILDSRGKKTIEVELVTDLGKFLSSVPSGTSKGKYEAVEKKAKIAVRNVNKIIGPKLKGKDPTHQKEIDEILIKLDGTKKKNRLGANAILGVSIAVLRAGAKAKKMPLWKWISKLSDTKPSLPTPSILLFEGGLHAPSSRVAKAKVKKKTQLSSSRSGLGFQEFMAVFPGKSFGEKLREGIKAYNQLGKILRKKYGKKGIILGMEGAFIPPVKSMEEALDLLMKVAQKKKIKIILDVAATSFFKKGKYYFEKRRFNRGELLDFYLKLCQKYPIKAIEDPFYEEDWQGWKKINEKCKMQKEKLLIIGDDLTATNPGRIKLAHKKKACKGVIIKPNQIGTVFETITAAKLAKSYGWKTMVSHRSGETKDDFIADLSVGLGADFIKTGAPSKIERMVKYNRLVKIEEEI